MVKITVGIEGMACGMCEAHRNCCRIFPKSSKGEEENEQT